MINRFSRASGGGVLAFLILSIACDVRGFEIPTHRLLNGRVADVSTLDNYLKEQLGFAGGILETFNGKQVRLWIEEGGAAEDQFLNSESFGAAFRSRHHFHNPLLPWGEAGLNTLSLCPPFVLKGESSVRWAQMPNQGVSGKASWRDARTAFSEALTQAFKTERDNAWARTFQILGQQMHLIADLAVPALGCREKLVPGRRLSQPRRGPHHF